MQEIKKQLSEYLELSTKLLDLDCELNLLENESFNRLSIIKQELIERQDKFKSN